MAKRTNQPQTALEALRLLPDEALIDVSLCALLLGCSSNTIWRRARGGVFPTAIRVSSGQTRWRLGDVRAHLAALSNQPKAA